jgi:hypothetical protein
MFYTCSVFERILSCDIFNIITQDSPSLLYARLFLNFSLQGQSREKVGEIRV